MKENFEAFMPHLLKSEGGFVNDPRDNGGATNKGVTLKTYSAYRRAKKQQAPKIADLKKITAAELTEIYRWQYWEPIWGDDLPAGIDICVFDFAVHSGPTQAIKSLQRVVKADVDGDMGVETLRSVERAMGEDEDDTINAYLAARMRFMKALSDWAHYGRGWTNRVNNLRRRAVALAASDDGPIKEEPEGASGPKAAPDSVGILKTRAGKAVAAIVAGGAGTIGSENGGKLLEHAETVRGFADYLPWLGIVAGVIAVAGVGWLVFDLFMKRKEGSLT